MTTEEIIKLVLETTGQEGLKKLADEAFRVKDALDQVEQSAEKVEQKSIDLGALAASGQGLFAAFQTGEIPGIIQGVGSLIELVPGLNTFAPAIKKIGNVSEVAWPFLKDVYKLITEEPEKVEEAAKVLADYGERLTEAGEAVQNMTDRQASLNAELERGKKAAEAEAAAITKLNALQPEQTPIEADEAANEKERSEVLTGALGGKQEDVIEEIAKGEFHREWKNNQDELRKIGAEADKAAARGEAVSDEILARIEELQNRIELMNASGKAGIIPKDIQDRARGKAARAIIGGQQGAIRDIVDMLDEGDTRDILKSQLPEEKANRDAEMKAAQEAHDRARTLKEAAAAMQTPEAILDRQQDDKRAADKAAHEQEVRLREAATKQAQEQRDLRQSIQDGQAAFKLAHQLREQQRQMQASSGMQGRTIDNNQDVLQQLQQEAEQNRARWAQSQQIRMRNRTAQSNGIN